MKSTLVLVLVALSITVSDQSVYSEPEETNNSISLEFEFPINGQDQAFFAKWKYDERIHEIVFNVSATIQGWFAIGISKTNYNMTDLDIFLFNSTRNFTDFYAKNSSILPTADKQQNGKLLFYDNTGSITKASVKRKLDTGDSDDITIKAGEMYYIAFAFSDSTSSFGKHTFQRYTKEKKMLVPAQPSTASPSSTQVSGTKTPTNSTQVSGTKTPTNSTQVSGTKTPTEPTQVSGTKTPTKPSCAAGIWGLPSALLLFPSVLVAMFFC